MDSLSVHLVAWPGHDTYLVSYPKNDEARSAMSEAGKRDYADWAQHAVTWSDDVVPRLVATPVGPEGLNVVNFAVSPSGTLIFWPQTRDPRR